MTRYVKIGAKKLPLDEKFVINVPNNTIDERGREAIKDALFSVGLNHGRSHWSSTPLPADWNWDWLITQGEYRGTFPKRVAKYFALVHNIKLDANELSTIGSIAKKYCPTGEFTVDLTHKFDWEAGDFGDRGSCFWNGSADARKVLKRNKALAIRFYDQLGKGNARAWVAQAPFGWVVFNGYGHSTPTIARILADYVGYVYKKIELVNHGSVDGLLYINHYATEVHDDKNFAIGTYEDLTGLSRYDLQWYAKTCRECYGLINENHEHYMNRRYAASGPYCGKCFARIHKHCSMCKKEFYIDDVSRVGGRYYCHSCEEATFDSCTDCGLRMKKGMGVVIPGMFGCYCEQCAGQYKHCKSCDRIIGKSSQYSIEGEVYCNVCANNLFTYCNWCNTFHPAEKVVRVDQYGGRSVCQSCYGAHFGECHHCGRIKAKRDLNLVDGVAYCAHCYRSLFFTCFSCRQTLPVDEARHSPGVLGQYCPTCFAERYTQCTGPGCEKMVHRERAYAVVGGNRMCLDCYMQYRREHPSDQQQLPLGFTATTSGASATISVRDLGIAIGRMTEDQEANHDDRE